MSDPQLPEIPQPRKPVRAWRGYVKEYVVIVVGVLTALAAQQAADWWRWQSEVAQARQTIASEMARNVAYGIQRMRLARCLQTKVRDIDKLLADAARSGELPPLESVGGAPLVPWSSSAWESIVASQTATHFPRRQLTSLSLTYRRIERIENWNRQEIEAWSMLGRLAGPGRRFEPAFGSELHKALGLVQTYNNIIPTTSMRFIQDAQGLDLPFTAEERRQMAGAMVEPLRHASCAPLGAAPVSGAVNLAAFSEASLREFEDAVKRLPYGAQAGSP
jgi:hypothetical protein